jgi:LPXTG-motif cell wall-anchored protein
LARNSSIGGSTYGLAPDFLVSLPYQNDDGEWVYSRTARPKLDENPYSNKDIDEEFVDAMGNLRIRWAVELEIREGIQYLLCVGQGTCDCCDCDEVVCECPCDPTVCCDVFITMTDNMDPRLTLQPTTVNVFFYCDEEEVRTNLIRDTHWELVYVPGSSTFTVEINGLGIQLMNTAGAPGMLHYTFETTLNAVPCEDCDVHDFTCDDCRYATLGSLENAVDFGYGRNSNFRTPGTGVTTLYEIQVRKVGTNNAPLAGAVFHLFLESQMTTDADGNRVPRPEFRDYPIAIYTTGANGIATFRPLIAGVYYLYEHEAPAGYRRLVSGTRIIVAPTTVSEDYDYVVIARITNVLDLPELPMTGGMGTVLLTIIGALLLGGATLFFVSSKRRKA